MADLVIRTMKSSRYRVGDLGSLFRWILASLEQKARRT
jgi:hypothetical protein